MRKLGRSIQEIFRDDSAITGAIQRAVREAVLEHARAGRPVSTEQGGKVVWLQPEEVFRLLKENPPPY